MIWRALLLCSLTLAFSFSVAAQTRIHRSPNGKLRALVIPVGNPGFEDQESRIEIKDARGRTLRWRSFASADGQHGYGVNHIEWSADSEFLVFNLYNSGGHQPWRLPTYFYSVRKNRFYNLEDFIGPVTADFQLRGTTVVTKRMVWDRPAPSGGTEEPVRVRLNRLVVLSR